jgi:hypothetical protein
MKRKTLLFLVTLLLIASAFAQRRTTSVKGYYRKNGTYVSPHTRGYTAGSSTPSQYSSISSATSKGDDIGPTKLKFISEEAINDSISPKDKKLGLGIVFYVSVLRYNGKTLDVCPIPRGYSDWSFEKVKHKFDKKLLSTEDALDLISNYDWLIYNDQISKDFSYVYNDKGFPSYLTKTIEAIKVE